MVYDITVRIFPDGNMICALVGENLQKGIGGFGKTDIEALQALVDNLEDVNRIDEL